MFSYLQDKEAVKELFDVIAPKLLPAPVDIPVLLSWEKELGDNAELAMIELVDYNEIYGKGIGETEGSC